MSLLSLSPRFGLGKTYTMNRTEEHTLIARAQQGYPEVFTRLVSKYQPRVYNHILGKVKDSETAKDLTQET